MYCIKCGSWMEDDEQFCRECGTDAHQNITEKQSSPMKPKKQATGKIMLCKSCGERIAIKAKTCPHCGAKNKKPFYKRGWFITVCVLFVLCALGSLGGSSNSEKQEALLDYINSDMVELAELETKMLESYGTVTGSNYTDDLTMYLELNTTTVELCRELNEKAVNINPIDEEISALHSMYRNYTYKYLNAISTILDALEEQDRAKITEANDLINDANNLAVEYQQELYRLAEKYNI